MLKMCTKCKTNNDQDGNYCQFCGNKMLRIEPDKQKSVVTYLHNTKNFQDFFEAYEDDGLTMEQIRELYNTLHEVRLMAKFEGNTLIKLEVV